MLRMKNELSFHELFYKILICLKNKDISSASQVNYMWYKLTKDILQDRASIYIKQLSFFPSVPISVNGWEKYASTIARDIYNKKQEQKQLLYKVNKVLKKEAKKSCIAGGKKIYPITVVIVCFLLISIGALAWMQDMSDQEREKLKSTIMNLFFMLFILAVAIGAIDFVAKLGIKLIEQWFNKVNDNKKELIEIITKTINAGSTEESIVNVNTRTRNKQLIPLFENIFSHFANPPSTASSLNAETVTSSLVKRNLQIKQ